MRLKELRQARGLAQAALATRAGLSEFTVLRLEQGRFQPHVLTLHKLATALGLELEQLLPPEQPGSELGAYLRKHRLAHGLSQVALARAAGVGGGTMNYGEK